MANHQISMQKYHSTNIDAKILYVHKFIEFLIKFKNQMEAEPIPDQNFFVQKVMEGLTPSDD